MAATNPTQAELQQMIVASAQAHGVDPSLALAIAKTESNFNPAAINTSNTNGTADYGLMQINSSNLASLGLDSSSALDPQANINAAMQLLSSYTQKYGDNPNLIAWAYNAGPGSVSSGSVPQSTSSYISQVLANQQNFSGIAPADSSASDTLSLSDALSPVGDTNAQIDVAGVTVPTSYALAGGLAAFLLLAWWLSD